MISICKKQRLASMLAMPLLPTYDTAILVLFVRRRITDKLAVISENTNHRCTPSQGPLTRPNLGRNVSSLLRLRLSSPVLSRTLGNELSPSGTIVCSISRVTPVNTQYVQIFLQCVLPCPLWSSNPPPAIFW